MDVKIPKKRADYQGRIRVWLEKPSNFKLPLLKGLCLLCLNVRKVIGIDMCTEDENAFCRESICRNCLKEEILKTKGEKEDVESPEKFRFSL